MDRINRLMLGAARGLAILGGVVLGALILMVVVSILGRELNAGLNGDFAQAHAKPLADWLLSLRFGALRIAPVTGDYELVQAGMAFAIFAFLPLAQITAGHATVDVFTNWLPERGQRVLIALIEVVFALVLILIAMQLWEGTQAKIKRGQTTFLLQMPIWWSYLASLVGAGAASVVALWTATVRIGEAATGRDLVVRSAEEAA